jgi:L-asparagine transporter-like permease
MSYIDTSSKNRTCVASINTTLNGSNNTGSICGNGGFVPFGVTGVFRGVVQCFYAYTGFDAR